MLGSVGGVENTFVDSANDSALECSWLENVKNVNPINISNRSRPMTTISTEPFRFVVPASAGIVKGECGAWNAECGVRNAEHSELRIPNSEFRIFLCAFMGRPPSFSALCRLTATQRVARVKRPLASN